MRVPLALRRFNTPLMQRAWLPALSLVLGGLLQWFPFLRSIDYPLSLIATPTMAVLGAIVGVRGATTGPLSERLAGGLVQVTIASALFVLPAVITSAWTGIVCEPLYGLLFLLMGPLCSAWMGLILGHYMGALLPAGWALALIPLLLLGSVAIAVLTTSGPCDPPPQCSLRWCHALRSAPCLPSLGDLPCHRRHQLRGPRLRLWANLAARSRLRGRRPPWWLASSLLPPAARPDASFSRRSDARR